MHRTRLTAASLFAAGMLIIAVSSASGANENQRGKGKQAPEVPVAAGLPVVATLSGASFYLVARARSVMSRSKRSSRTDSSESPAE